MIGKTGERYMSIAKLNCFNSYYYTRKTSQDYYGSSDTYTYYKFIKGN